MDRVNDQSRRQENASRTGRVNCVNLVCDDDKPRMQSRHKNARFESPEIIRPPERLCKLKGECKTPDRALLFLIAQHFTLVGTLT